MKNNVYLFQPGVSHGRGEFLAYYLPYSIGSVWSYVNQFDEIKRHYQLQDIVFRREKPDELIQRIDEPSVAAFSCYLWNWQWCLAVANEVKKKWPSCLIIFGGPQVPEHQNHRLFKDYDFIDIATHAEGETTFHEILQRHLNSGDLSGIPGSSIPGPIRETIFQPRRIRMELDKIETPSPYLDGTFDTLLENHPNIEWHAVTETHRGCPFACTFCDWGSLIHAKIKRFDLEKVFAEIEWLGKNGIAYIFLADANFGAFHDRDSKIVDKYIQIKEGTGYPEALGVTWFKNSTEKTLRLAHKLMETKLSRGLTLSVQSMNPATLEAVKRDNMKFSQLSELFNIAEHVGLPTLTEMILGLPEETLDTWMDGACQILELGNHNTLTFYPGELLENAELNAPEVKTQYGIESTSLYNWAWEPDISDTDGIEEVSEIICATNTLPREDYIEALMFSWMILNFHVEGWTQVLSRFLRKKKNIQYTNFYRELFAWIKSPASGLLHTEYTKMKKAWIEYFETGRPGKHAYHFKNMQVQGYMQIHASQYTLRANHELTWNAIVTYFQKHYGYLELGEYDDLLKFQYSFVSRFGAPFEFNESYGYNIWEYIIGDEDIRFGKYRYEHKISETYDKNDIGDFLRKIYFRRRSGFGRLQIKQMPDAPAQTQYI